MNRQKMRGTDTCPVTPSNVSYDEQTDEAAILLQTFGLYSLDWSRMCSSSVIQYKYSKWAYRNAKPW